MPVIEILVVASDDHVINTDDPAILRAATLIKRLLAHDRLEHPGD